MNTIIKRPLYPETISHTVEPKIKPTLIEWMKYIHEKNKYEDEILNEFHKKLEAK